MKGAVATLAVAVPPLVGVLYFGAELFTKTELDWIDTLGLWATLAWCGAWAGLFLTSAVVQYRRLKP